MGHRAATWRRTPCTSTTSVWTTVSSTTSKQDCPSGTDTATGVPIGFFTFSDGSPVAIADQPTPPTPESFEYGTPNSAMATTMTVTGFAGFIHNFANDAVDTWTPQDWSAYEGFAFWLYGQNSGTDLFIDLIENRNPGSDGRRCRAVVRRAGRRFQRMAVLRVPVRRLLPQGHRQRCAQRRIHPSRDAWMGVRCPQHRRH